MPPVDACGAGKGNDSLVSRRRVPGRDVGEPSPKVPGLFCIPETDALRFGPSRVVPSFVVCCVGNLMGEFTELRNNWKKVSELE